MISREKVEAEIRELESATPNWNNCEKLAIMYVLCKYYDEMKAIEEIHKKSKAWKENTEIIKNDENDDESEEAIEVSTDKLKIMLNSLSKTQLVNLVTNHAYAMKQHGHIKGWNRLIERVKEIVL